MFSIDSDKLQQVTEKFNDEVDPRATSDLVKFHLTEEGNQEPMGIEEHQSWLDNSPISDIVDWLASFYN